MWRIYNAETHKLLELEMRRILIDLMRRQLHNMIKLANYFKLEGQLDFNSHLISQTYVGFKKIIFYLKNYKKVPLVPIGTSGNFLAHISAKSPSNISHNPS